MMTALGEEYVRNLYLEEKVTYTANHQRLAEWIARGIYSIGLGAVKRIFEPMRKEGLPIGVIASFGDAPGYLTGGSGRDHCIYHRCEASRRFLQIEAGIFRGGFANQRHRHN
jgi:hypothetical protein